jgi:hypothetical protein
LLVSMLSLKASMRATKVGRCTGKPCDTRAGTDKPYDVSGGAANMIVKWWPCPPVMPCRCELHHMHTLGISHAYAQLRAAK